MGRAVSRRDFLASGLVALGAVAAGPSVWRRALAQPVATDGPYGPLRPPDVNGIMLPDGFVSRVIARSGRIVPGSDYVWHDAPDGGATFDTEDGWIYVSNSEVSANGGVGAVRFARNGEIVDAYRIASQTSRNCSGGPTPWGTWLSCEEHSRGLVWECDPLGEHGATPRPALGVFQHEAAAVDRERKHIYLTEDEPDGCFYRFVPDPYPSLETGVLEAASVATDGSTTWIPVPDPAARARATRHQLDRATRFDGGEGTWYDAGNVYFTTKGDDRVWVYDAATQRMSVLYEGRRGGALSGVDNVTVAAHSGDVYVAEDGGNLEIVVISPEYRVEPILRVVGSAHRGSELAGPALDPAGERLYFSSQRGFDRGITFEVRGPFRRTRRPRGTPPPAEPAEDNDWLLTTAAAGGVASAAAIFGIARRRSRRPETEE